MKRIFVNGVGLFCPWAGSPEAFVEQLHAPHGLSGPSDASPKPPCRLIPPRLKRGTSLLTQMLGEVVEQAATYAGVAASDVATVYGSRFGELETAVTLLEMLFRDDGRISPSRFKNSVHNAASGLVSIGTGNRAFSTAIAGGSATFAASFLEAFAYLQSAGGDVILAVGDDALPEPFRASSGHEPLALSFCLGTERRLPNATRLQRLRRQGAGERPPALAAAPMARFVGNAAEPGLALLVSVWTDPPERVRTVGLARGADAEATPRANWWVDVGG